MISKDNRQKVYSIFAVSILVFSLVSVLFVPESSAVTPTYFGEQIPSASLTGYPLSASTTKYSMDFTANYTKYVRAVGIYVQSVVGTSPFYKIGFQGDSGGLPDNTYVNNTLGLFKPTAAGWTQILLNGTVKITKGNTVHLVILYLNGTINGSNFMNVGREPYLYQVYGYDGTLDTRINTRRTTVASWSGSNLDLGPLYFLNFTDSTFQGETYTLNYAAGAPLIYGNNRVGETFTPTSTHTVGALEVLPFKYGSPSSNLYFQIYNNTGSSVLYNASFVSVSDTPTACCAQGMWVRYIFPSPITLTSGMNYTLFFYTAGGNSTVGYNLNYVYTPSITDAGISRIVINQTWGGPINRYVSTAAGGVPRTSNTAADLVFRFTVGAVTTLTTTTVTSTTTSTTRTTSVICYPPPASNRQYTFFDGFETGNFSKWNATAAGGSSSVTVSSLHPINGTYSMNVSIGGGANQYGYAQGKDNLTALGNNYWFSWYVRIETIQHVANKHVYFLSLRNATGSFARFGIFHEGTAEHELNVEVYDPNLGTLESLSTDIMLVNNATNHLEFHLFKNATGGYAEGYLNGTAVVHLHLGKSDYAAYTLDVFRVGSTLASQISSFNMQVDNVAVDGSRIGQDPFSCVGYSTSVKIIPLQTQITPNNLFLLILSPLTIIPFLILYSQKRRKQLVPN